MNKYTQFLAECIVTLGTSILTIFVILYLLFCWIVIAPLSNLQKTLEEHKKEDKNGPTRKS